MNFNDFNKAITDHFEEMTKDVKRVFEVEFDYEEMNNLYLDSFPSGTNEIYRKRREYDCSCCRHFIRDIGNAVVIKDGKLHTIWELDIDDKVYSVVAKALDQYIREKAIKVYILEKKKELEPLLAEKYFQLVKFINMIISILIFRKFVFMRKDIALL